MTLKEFAEWIGQLDGVIYQADALMLMKVAKRLLECEARIKAADELADMVDYSGVYKDCPALREKLDAYREAKA